MLGQRGSIFGVAALDMARNDSKFVLLTADLATLSGMDRFIKTYPDKFLNIGIAEQNMIGIAAGLASEGFHPVATTYATFLTMRACEQIRHYLGYMKQNVVIIGSGAGLSQGYAGNTHYTIEDISVIRAIPNIKILSPADGASAVKLFNASMMANCPIYIRLTGSLNCPVTYKNDIEFMIGGSYQLTSGNDIAIYACGTMVNEAIKVSENLKDCGYSAIVFDMYSIKPIDVSAIEKARGTKLIVSIEEHNRIGGLGATIAEIITEKAGFPNLLRLGISDCFDLADDYNGLLYKNRLTASQITEDIIKAL